MLHSALLASLLLIGLTFAACAGHHRGPSTPHGSAPMTLIYLETGPNSASHTPEQKREIFTGHMANMQRLADEKTLLIAGPFGQPRDPAWRGIFVFDIADAAQASTIAATDPGVSAGEFRLRLRPITTSSTARELPRLAAELEAELKAQGQPERKPGEPPPGLRTYVMMHADDAARAQAAIQNTKHGPRIVWNATFRDGPGGVFVLDATTTVNAESSLRGLDVGPYALDRWLSTQALERLATLATAAPR